jgi:hypothetical protein
MKPVPAFGCMNGRLAGPAVLVEPPPRWARGCSTSRPTTGLLRAGRQDPGAGIRSKTEAVVGCRRRRIGAQHLQAAGTHAAATPCAKTSRVLVTAVTALVQVDAPALAGELRGVTKAVLAAIGVLQAGLAGLTGARAFTEAVRAGGLPRQATIPYATRGRVSPRARGVLDVAELGADLRAALVFGADLIRRGQAVRIHLAGAAELARSAGVASDAALAALIRFARPNLVERNAAAVFGNSLQVASVCARAAGEGSTGIPVGARAVIGAVCRAIRVQITRSRADAEKSVRGVALGVGARGTVRVELTRGLRATKLAVMAALAGAIHARRANAEALAIEVRRARHATSAVDAGLALRSFTVLVRGAGLARRRATASRATRACGGICGAARAGSACLRRGLAGFRGLAVIPQALALARKGGGERRE